MSPANDTLWIYALRRISIYDEGGKTILATLKPTTLLTLFNTPQLKAVAQEVESTWLNHAAIGCN